MIVAYQFPDAFKRGFDDCVAHYSRVHDGAANELDFPPHPYPEPDGQRDTEWHAYNAGWFFGLEL